LRYLAPLDKALVLIFVPLWIVCFALGVRTQVMGGGDIHLELLLEDAQSLPVLTGEYSRVLYPSSPLEAAGLRAGDTLVRVGESDLRGVNSLDFVGIAREEAGLNLAVEVAYERGGKQHQTTIALAPVSIFLPYLAASFTSIAAALFLLLRARPTPTVRAYFHFSLPAALGWINIQGGRFEAYMYFGLMVVSATLISPLLIRFFQLFPDDIQARGWWPRIWPWFFSLNGPVVAFSFFCGWCRIGEGGTQLGVALTAVTILVVTTVKYRRGDLRARRQMKWVLFGLYCISLPLVVTTLINAVEPRLGWLFPLSVWTTALFPVFLFISVARYNLFDIDRLISTTASYNILLVTLIGAGLAVVPRAAEAASALVGINAAAGQVMLSLTLAAIVVPANRRLRPQIDRFFFAQRYALDQGIKLLLQDLMTCEGPDALTRLAGERLHQLLRPETCVVYAGGEGGYAPVFIAGRAVPPAYEPDSLLVATLQKRLEPLALEALGRSPDVADLNPFDRAALETLGAAVVLPVRRGAGLLGFLCLGPKRSGDVYTSTDLALLTAVANSASTELMRFNLEELNREARAMQESLRRFVPGAIAEQLSSGAELASGEREVSVLFVDIRGYTGFAESRRAEEVFSTVNRYTEVVSQIVQKHGGSVVEFNGDGMMAVFGAPRELSRKEQAAVEAGREIATAVGALPVEDTPLSETKLAVGVGIATGEAFVGNIQAVDRMIWSAIGNTTNLAARLQSLTRELGASLLIDTRTWERAQPVAADFEKRSEVPIRGRRETQDVYALPLLSDS
jgi:class 3 adenylate cyclase